MNPTADRTAGEINQGLSLTAHHQGPLMHLIALEMTPGKGVSIVADLGQGQGLSMIISQDPVAGGRTTDMMTIGGG